MELSCAHCGQPFEAKTAQAQFCGRVECSRARARERKRVQRGTVVELPRESAGQGVEAATREALEAAGRADSPAGRAALVLAARLDGPSQDTGSGLAALVKQHLATLEEALRDAPKAADGVDELRARREARRGAG